MDSVIKTKLREKIKKVAQEKEELKQQCEDLMKKERQFFLGQKLHDDLARRLRLMHADLEKTKKELQQEQLLHASKDRDLNILKVELGEVQHSEKTIREERSRILQEVSQLRDRVKELDAEKKRLNHLNKFVSKHATDPAVIPGDRSSSNGNNNSSMNGSNWTKSHRTADSSSSSSTQAAGNPSSILFGIGSNMDKSLHQSMAWSSAAFDESSAVRRSPMRSGVTPTQEVTHLMKDDRKKSALSSSLASSLSSSSYLQRSSVDPATSMITPTSKTYSVGLAGVNDAEYYRFEEANTTLHPELETALSVMHNNIVEHSPKLLPMFKQLQNQINSDRARTVVEKSKLLGKLYEKKVSAKQQQQSRPTSNPRARANEYQPMDDASFYGGGGGQYRVDSTMDGSSHNNQSRSATASSASSRSTSAAANRKAANRQVSGGIEASHSNQGDRGHITRKINFEDLKKRARF